MSFDDWLLALHILSAFALVGAIVVFWVAILALRRTDLPEQVVAAGQTGPDATLAELARTRRGSLFHWIATLATLLILIDMIWKPGA